MIPLHDLLSKVSTAFRYAVSIQSGYKRYFDIKLYSFAGTVGSNSLSGCQKCCTIGVHSTILKCTIFPKTICTERTDKGFRARKYLGHHKDYKIREIGKKRLRRVPIVSPLLQLNIDMVQDIVVADSLHLLHLGIMKRLLKIFIEGHPVCDYAKLKKCQVEKLSALITAQKTPLEIHRSVRGLGVISHWKGSECAVFLNYIGIGALKHFLNDDLFKMFVYLFCATTICSSGYYRRLWPVAHKLFEHFIAFYYKIFNSVTSNVHNLIHVSSECERFGGLDGISTYPFENHLYVTRNLIRSGNHPLEQVANRLTEIMYANENVMLRPIIKYPVLFNSLKNNPNKYSGVKLRENSTLTSDYANKWFFTKSCDIVSLKYIDQSGICGETVIEMNNVFDQPFPSSVIHVYQTKNLSNMAPPKMFAFSDVICKFFITNIYGVTIFVPLHHTLPSQND